MDHVAFTTDNISELRKYLIANGVKAPEIESRSDHSLSLTVKDPEGHGIEFVERSTRVTRRRPCCRPTSAFRSHMIHVGFLVHSREAEDHFYRDLLGFRLYWHGGMKPDKTDWVAMQVPDGTDWLEYMLGWSEHLDLAGDGCVESHFAGRR